MKRLLLPLLAATLTFAACGNNEADNDTSTDTTTAAPADGTTGSMDGANGTGTDMNNMNGQPGDGNAPGTSGMGADNAGTGISGGQGNNPSAGSNAAGTGAPYPVDGISTADGAGPTSTRNNRDNVTNDSLNNRTGMGSSR